MPESPPRTPAKSPSTSGTLRRRRGAVVLVSLALPLATSLVVAPAASAAPKVKAPSTVSPTASSWSASSWSARAWAASSWSASSWSSLP